jgi:hypothetical protein
MRSHSWNESKSAVCVQRSVDSLKCISQCLSQLAASFIVTRPETSTAKSCVYLIIWFKWYCLPAPRHNRETLLSLKINHVEILFFNDPTAGSPTVTVLRLVYHSGNQVYKTSPRLTKGLLQVRIIHRITQSVRATGGVYKGQGRNRRKLMTCAY